MIRMFSFIERIRIRSTLENNSKIKGGVQAVSFEDSPNVLCITITHPYKPNDEITIMGKVPTEVGKSLEECEELVRKIFSYTQVSYRLTDMPIQKGK